MKVKNLLGENGKRLFNYFVVEHENIFYLQAENVTVCRIDGENVTIGKFWNQSRTTTKYMLKFIKETAYEVWLLSLCNGTDRKIVENAIDNGILNYDEKLM